MCLAKVRTYILRHIENYINAGGWINLFLWGLRKGPYTQICFTEFIGLHCNLLKTAAWFEPWVNSRDTTKRNGKPHSMSTIVALFNSLLYFQAFKNVGQSGEREVSFSCISWEREVKPPLLRTSLH